MNVADHNLDRLAYHDGHLAVRAGKFFDRDKTFGFIAKINQNSAVGNTNNLSLNQLAGMINRLLLLKLFEYRAKIDVVFCRRFFGRRCIYLSSGRLWDWCGCFGDFNHAFRFGLFDDGHCRSNYFLRRFESHVGVHFGGRTR